MNRYFIDCGSGVAGDMMLGAWIGLGLSVTELQRALKRGLPAKDWHLKVTPVDRQQWPARTVKVVGDRPFGGPAKMKAAVRRFGLPAALRNRALRVIGTLEEAEREAHGHHEAPVTFEAWGLGLMDTLVDVVGNLWAMHRLGIERVDASPVNTGRLAPATVHLAQRFKLPVYGQGIAHELATPTGVALLGEIAERFGPLDPGVLCRAGYGAGSHDFPGRPNVLAIYEREARPANSAAIETVIQLETLIDDMDPRLYPYVSDLLFAVGALDVWWTAVGTKKGRPGIAFQVMAPPAREKEILDVLFRETSTLGVRRAPVERHILDRESGGLWKRARLPGGGAKHQSEFEVAKALALKTRRPLINILRESAVAPRPR